MTGNKGEWSEIYALLKLISDKKLTAGDENLNKIENLIFPIIRTLREESDGTYEYSYEKDLVVVKGNENIFRISIVKFQEQVIKLLQVLKTKSQTTFSIPEIENFIHSFNCKALKAPSKDKNDIHIVIYDERIGTTPKLGFNIKSHIGKSPTLFNASQSSNFIYKIVGNLTDTDISMINNIHTSSKIRDRVNAICDKVKLEFVKTESTIFQNNLVLIDCCLPAILAELIVLFNAIAESNLQTLVDIMEDVNPLRFNNKNGHKFYEYKMKRLLTDIALGMQPTKIWTGQLETTGGYLIVKENGDILCYHIYNRNEFENYLLANTRLINPSSSRNKFGLIYKENNELFFKLNVQIRFL